MRPLARGGWAWVYQAEDNSGRPCVLKEILPTGWARRPAGRLDAHPLPERVDACRWAVQRHLNGTRAASRWRHPGLLTPLDCVLDHGSVFTVWPLLNGQTLAERLHAPDGAGPRTVETQERRRWAADLLDALAVMHADGWLHLDLKPGNVMLTASGQAVIMDFDAAHQMDPAPDGPGFTPGAAAPDGQVFTPECAAPELRSQSCQDWGPWTDLFGLASCLRAAGWASAADSRSDWYARSLDPDPRRRPPGVEAVWREDPGLRGVPARQSGPLAPIPGHP